MPADQDNHLLDAQPGARSDDVIQGPARSGRADPGPGGRRRRTASWLRLAWWVAGRLLLVALLGWDAWSARFSPAAVVPAVLAAMLLVSGVARLGRLIRAVRGNDEVTARLRSSGRMVLADNVMDGQSLEWRVLRGQPRVAGAVRICGPVGSGRWLVVRSLSGRLVWPRSRAQPVIGTGTPQPPAVIVGDEGPLAAVHKLLAGYVQAIRLLAALPLMIQRPPGPSMRWWRIGVPRPAIQALVVIQMRRRLTALASALVHQAMQTGDSDGRNARARLLAASTECRALAGSLPRSGWLAVAATICTTALAVYGPFVPWLTKLFLHHVWPALLVGLALGVVPFLMFFRAVSCKRALLSPATAMPKWVPPHQATWLCAEWDVYQLENDAFASVRPGELREWESRRWIPWLVIAVYCLAAGIPLSRAIHISGNARITWYVFGEIIIIPSVVTLYALDRWHRVRAARKRLKAQSRPSEAQPDRAAQLAE
jgi:hypothetical protein